MINAVLAGETNAAKPLILTCARCWQLTIINECVWRHRQLYDFIVYIDRDEFIQVVGKSHKDVDLASMLHAHLDGTKFASASLYAALYHVFCSRDQLPALGRPDDSHLKPEVVVTYSGYDVWAPDTRQPDFFNCTSDWWAEIFKPPGRQCHTKSIIRPLLVEYMLTHYVHTPAEGYIAIPKPLSPGKAFLKHVRCVDGGSHGSAHRDPALLCQRREPIDYAEAAPDGVEVCQQDE